MDRLKFTISLGVNMPIIELTQRMINNSDVKRTELAFNTSQFLWEHKVKHFYEPYANPARRLWLSFFNHKAKRILTNAAMHVIQNR